MMDKFDLIIFDLDGTLVNAYAAIEKSLNYALFKMGYKKKAFSAIQRAVGWGDENLIRPFVKPADLAKALKIYRKHHSKALAKYSYLFPEVIGLLGYLKTKDYKLAVASNRPSRFLLILMRHLRIYKYFDFVLCKDKLREGKPHPEILYRIIKKLNVSPSRTLYVGDMHIDAQTARRAGIRSVIVTTGSSSKREIRLEKPYRVIREIKSLKKIL